MADRLAQQYPMIPTFSPALLHQQQQQQQHQHQQQQQQHQQQQQQQQNQQQQQDLHSQLSGFPDQGRMWQQIQHMQQLRQGGGDMNNPQANAQMMEILRNQAIARAQSQQQQQQLNNPQFGLSGQQMGNGIVGGPQGGNHQQQSQSFLDAGPNQQQQPHIQPPFPGSAGLSPAPSMQQSMSRNAAMIQAFQANPAAHANNPNVVRQLELMLAQSQQQPQNGAMNLAARMEQQRQAQHQQLQGMNHSSPPDLFPSPAMADRRPSPAHPNVQVPHTIGGPQQPQQSQHVRRQMTAPELSARAEALKRNIAQSEAAINQMNAARGSSPDAMFHSKMKTMMTDVAAKKEYLNKMNDAIQAMMPNSQHQQQNGGLPSWMPQTGPQPFETAGMTRAQVPPNSSQTGPSNVEPSPSHLHAQLQPQGPGSLPRSVSASHPQQLPPNGGGVLTGSSPFSSQVSPNLAQQLPLSMSNGGGSPPAMNAAPSLQQTPSGPFPPPLEKVRFDSTYGNWARSRNLKHDVRLMSVDGRMIDLHSLHTHVMNEGGWSKVQSKELWSIIGARMGFVSFPGAENEPATSGPGVAQRLAQVYKEYVAGFDQVYINSVAESRRKMHASNNSQLAAASTAASGNPGQPPQIRGPPDPRQMQMLVNHANTSVAELRTLGLPDKIITFIEGNRAHLQRTQLEQGMFRGGFQNQGSLRQPDQLNGGPGNGGMGSPMHPFQQGGSTQQTAAASMTRLHQQFMPQNGAGPIGTGNGRPSQGHPFLPNGGGAAPLMRLGFSQQQIEMARAFIQKTRQEFIQNNLPNMRGTEVPVEQRVEFNNILGQLQGFAQQTEGKLHMYYFVPKSEETIKKLIAIILTVNQQRQLLNSGNPRYIVGLDILRNMMHQVQQSNDMFTAFLQRTMNPQQQQQHQHQQQQHQHQQHQQQMQHGTPPNHATSGMPQPNGLSQQQPMPPQSLLPPNRPAATLRPPQVLKKASTSTPAASGAALSSPTPPPPYSATTPVASAPTPTANASSPQGTRSPKGRAPAKAKPPKRRPSVKNSAAPPLTAEQSQTSVASSSSSAGSNVKRQREEETTPGSSTVFGESPVASGSAAVNEPSPPKRMKTEWEEPSSDAPPPPKTEADARAEVVEKIKTEEDASAFLEQMTELIKMAAGEEGQESLTSDISETLDQILKGYGSVPDSSDSGLSLSLGESSATTPPPSIKAPVDEFVEYFDFSSFGAGEEDDDGSKAPTPELISSSCTNPSPESGSEADAAAHHALLSSMETKTEDIPDVLRLGTWKEIDGGESAYYQSGDWKWDSPMPTQEPPWAIFTS